MCSGREISYFGLARNLIQHLISPNQDDSSYSSRAFFMGNRKLGKLPNPLSLAGQRWPVQMSHCGSRIAAAAAWTHEGIHLIYEFLARNPSWI